MGWQGQEQDVYHLDLHAKQVYFGPQSLNLSSSTPSDTFLITQPSPAEREGGGAWRVGQTMLPQYYC